MVHHPFPRPAVGLLPTITALGTLATLAAAGLVTPACQSDSIGPDSARAAGASVGGAAGESAAGAAGAGGAAAAAGAAGAAGAGGAAAAAGAAGYGPGSKESCARPRPGPPMVSIPTPSGVSFCIDAHEVTMEQYQEFVNAIGKGPIPNHGDYCQKYNDRLLQTPPLNGPDGGPWCDLFDPVGHPDSPAMCVDWCDAAAYCTWAGKRLCGAIGGGETPLEKLDDPMSNEWLFVCTNGGKTKYAYGDEPDASLCKSPPPNDPRTSVSDSPGCRGVVPPFSEVTGLGASPPGGGGEFIGAAPEPGIPEMRLIVGNPTGTAVSASCYRRGTKTPTTPGGNTAFRCCAD